MAARLAALRLAAQAARGDLGASVPTVLGSTGLPEWQAELNAGGIPSAQQAPRQQQQQQYQSFYQGWSNAGPALAGSQALHAQQEQHQQQQTSSSAAGPSFLPWLTSHSGLLPHWPTTEGLFREATARGAATLMPPVGPGFPINEPLLKDAAPSRALLASFLTGATGSMPRKHEQDASRGRGGAQPRTRGSNSSIALNKEIMASSSIDQLLGIVRAHGAVFDFFNISTAVSRVPKLIESSPGHISNVTAMHACASATGPSAAATGSSSSGGGAELDTAAGKGSDQAVAAAGPGHLSPAAQELADRLCALVLQHLHEFDGRGLANTAWAFAKLRYVPDAALPAQLCRAAVDKIHQFAPQNVSNLAWALVYMHYQDPKLLHLLKEKACEQVYDMKPQELANVMWALASHEQLDERTAQVLGERAAGMAHVFKEQELSNIIWAMGRAGHYQAHVLQPLLSAAHSKLHSFMPQGVSNMVWALGQLGHRDEVLLHAVAQHCPRMLHQFDSQALSNLATGLAALSWEGHGLMHAVASEAAGRGSRMAGQHMVAVLAACTTLGVHHDRLVAAVSELVQTRAASLEPPALASLAWCVPRLGQQEPQLMEHLAAAVVSKIDRFSGQPLVAVSMAFAEAGEVGVRVLQAVAARLPSAVHSLTGPQCMAVSWALLQAGAQTPEAQACLMQQTADCAPVAAAPQGPRALQLCSCLLAAAQAGQRVEPHLHPALLAAACSCLPDMDGQQLANSCWALAVLGVLDVDTLLLFEAALEDQLTAANTTSLVGSAEVKQVCDARAMVATQLAQRVGLPLTSLPQHLLPPMPPTLAAATISNTSLFSSLLGSPEVPPQGNDLLPGYGAEQLRGVVGAGAQGVSAPSTGIPDLSLWGADVSALAVLSATQEAMQVSQQQRHSLSATTHSAQLLNLQLPGAYAPQATAAQSVLSPNTLAKWASVWNTGGLGNGLLGQDGSTSVSPSSSDPTGAPHQARSRRASGVEASHQPRSRRNSSASKSGARAEGSGAHLPTPLLATTLLQPTGLAEEWSMYCNTSSSTCTAGLLAPQSLVARRDSLEEQCGVWLPKDLLGGAALPEAL